LGSGTFNTFLGYSSGTSNTGDRNVVLGTLAGQGTAFSDTIAIGHGAQNTASNQISIGSTGFPLTINGSSSGLSTYLQILVNGTAYKIPLHLP